MSVASWFLIALFIILFSHLTVDRDFPDTLKVGSGVVFGLIALAYIVFGIIM